MPTETDRGCLIFQSNSYHLCRNFFINVLQDNPNLVQLPWLQHLFVYLCNTCNQLLFWFHFCCCFFLDVWLLYFMGYTLSLDPMLWNLSTLANCHGFQLLSYLFQICQIAMHNVVLHLHSDIFCNHLLFFLSTLMCLQWSGIVCLLYGQSAWSFADNSQPRHSKVAVTGEQDQSSWCRSWLLCSSSVCWS